MSGVELHRVERVLTDVAFEVSDRVSARTAERGRIGLAEYTEEWHVAASGFVNASEIVTTDVAISFTMDFFDAPEQRRSDLAMPTFHFGSYQAADTNFVVATAAVREWELRDDGAFVGATMTIGVHNPNGLTGDGEETTFDVLFHLSFSGWGAPYDVETDEEDTDPGP